MRRILAVAALLAFPAVSFAQGVQTAPTKDKEAERFNEIERGLFFGVSGGWAFVVNPPAASGPRPFSPGQTAMVEVGYEMGERLALSLFVAGSANRASATYIGHSDGTYSGDFSTLVPGVTVRANVIGFNDSQDVKRTWLYVRGGAGYALFSPRNLLPNGDVFVAAGPGIEYFTRLRHFSVGLEAMGTMLLTNGSFGFTVPPNLRYAF